MKFLHTEAIILRRTNYGEADRILNILTPSHGRIGAIAKGVRRPKSKLAGGLELFAICDVTLAQGRGDLLLVTGSRLQTFYGNILHDYDRLQFGYEAIKQIAQATETVGEPEFYDLLKRTLEALNNVAIGWQITEFWFGLQYMNLLGEGLNTTTDKHGIPLESDKRYAFDPSDRSFVASPQGEFGADHIKILRLALKTTPIVLSRLATEINIGRSMSVFVHPPKGR